MITPIMMTNNTALGPTTARVEIPIPRRCWFGSSREELRATPFNPIKIIDKIKNDINFIKVFLIFILFQLLISICCYPLKKFRIIYQNRILEKTGRIK
jgi:hypothetical protein